MLGFAFFVQVSPIEAPVLTIFLARTFLAHATADRAQSHMAALA